MSNLRDAAAPHLMYQALLTNRYLTSRVIPLIAVAAVALCVALVIIVVSVMTGFLNMVRSSGRTLMGDVIVAYPVTGIPHSERLIEEIARLPAAEAATPVVDGWGLLKMPFQQNPLPVQVWAVEPEGFARVTGYADTLYWRPNSDQDIAAMAEDDPRRLINERREGREATTAERLRTDGLSLRDARTGREGIVPGIHVSEANQRQKDGSIRPLADYLWLPHHELTLTMVPAETGGGALEPESLKLPVVNEFMSGVYLIDSKRVLIPLAVGQNLLHLDEGQIVDQDQVDPGTGLDRVIGPDPPRATMVLVRARDGFTPESLREQVEEAYATFHEGVRRDPAAIVKAPPPVLGASIKTWEEQQQPFLGPIEKERELMRTLFSLVYLVCAGLVLAIFWAIVYEKTRDIGILRSVGASRLGISAIFLRYGLVIGVVGAVAGLGLAWLIVRNINVIHSALGHPPVWLAVLMLALAAGAAALTAWRGRGGDLLPVTLGALVTITLVGFGAVILVVREQGGVVVWDPEVYYFTKVPNEMDTGTAAITMAGAVVFSLIGAFLPAARAADTDPVRALRYE